MIGVNALLTVVYNSNRRRRFVVKKPSHHPLHLSIVVPAHNEQEGIATFHASLVKVLGTIKAITYEIIYVDDGSLDATAGLLSEIADEDSRVKVLVFAKNFGKEIALSAGIDYASGEAVLTLDADGQHPVSLIPELIDTWRATDNDILIGIRADTMSDTIIKRVGSKLFYKILKLIAPDNRTQSSATDFRIISGEVADAFRAMSERDRMARGLIDWLGYKVEYFTFEAAEREYGTASYSTRKLVGLALHGITAASFKPLFLSLYIGFFALLLACAALIFISIGALLGDPLGINASGSAYFVLFVTILVGLVLIGQGMIAFYLSKMFVETQGRPLYVVHKRRSKNLG